MSPPGAPSGDRQYGPATSRVIRVVILFFGPAAVVFGALAMPAILSQSLLLRAWWSWPALVLTLGVPVLAAALSFSARVSALRTFMAVTAIGYAVAMILLPSALAGSMLAGSPWILALTAIGTTASAIAWRPRFVWPYVVLVGLLTGVDRFVAAGDGLIPTAAEDALYGLMFCSVFAGLALISIRAGRVLDTTADVARREAASLAATRARAQETARFDGLVHDTVLATLLAAARGPEADRAAASDQARLALVQLDAVRNEAQPTAQLSGEELVWRLQSTTTSLDPGARFTFELEPSVVTTGWVAAALAEATAEALRNSVEHAGHVAARAVHLRVHTDLLEVTIIDDGVGFDPQAVDQSRLGVSGSIVGRMSGIGGRATIVSEIGQGTRVVLEWVPR